MRNLALAILTAVALTGCSTLIPKKVEFFQDKVKQVPTATAKETEVTKEAASLAAKRAEETVLAAVSTGAAPEVVSPAKDTATLTKAVSLSLGPPAREWQGDIDSLARRVELSVAALDQRLESFRKENNENAGKKIEGTGLFSVPYFVWVGIVLVLGFIGFIVLSVLWTILKVYSLSNPPLAIGMNMAQATGSTIKKGFLQAVYGAEKFKNSIRESFDEDDAKKVLELFRQHQMSVQDNDVQNTIKQLTLK